MELLPDVIVDITYPVKEPGKTVIRTNAMTEMLADVIWSWCMTQIGQGDARTVVERDEYHIRITLDLADNSTTHESDCGNASLTCGIVLRVLAALERITIQPLQ